MTRSLNVECWRVIVSELDSIRDDGDFFSAILERSMNEEDLDLIKGIDVIISHPNTLIFEDLTIKNGEFSPPYNTRRVNEVVEFLSSLDTLDSSILHSLCSRKQKNISIIGFSTASFEPL